MTTSSMDGHAGMVIQARDINGGITISGMAEVERRVPRELPTDVRTLVGRDQQITHLLSLLRPGAPALDLLAIVGTAGVGKTALAVHLAHRLLPRYPDGQVFINLHGYDAGPTVLAATALERCLRALGVGSGAMPADLDERVALYHTVIGTRRLLILADNATDFHHVQPLLPTDGHSLLIATSRNRFAPLGMLRAHRETLGLLTPDHAAQLITTITDHYRSPDDPDDVRRLAALCANLPLALRITAERAAARPAMPLAELIADLTSESSLWHALTTGEEHNAETVRSVFSWSYRTLPGSIARAFRLLALHPGPDICTDVACALIDRPAHTVRALLDALAAGHLIEQTAADRYQFHDLLRAYAAQQVDGDEKPTTRRNVIKRATLWYLHNADAAAQSIQTFLPSVLTEPPPSTLPVAHFTDADQAHQWYRRERANLAAILRAAHAAHLDALAWQLAWTARPLYTSTNNVDDWTDAATLGLACATRTDDPDARARMLTLLAGAHHTKGDLATATDLYTQALHTHENHGTAIGVIESANSLGLIHFEKRELDQAQTQFKRVQHLATTADDPVWAAIALDNLAAVHTEAGHTDLALTHAANAYDQYQRHHVDARIAVVPLLLQARLHREHHHLGRARTLLDQAEQLLDSAGTFIAVRFDILLERAAFALAERRLQDAENTYQECRQLHHQLGHRLREATVLDGLGRTHDALGHYEQAADFFDQAIAVERNLSDAHRLADTMAAYALVLDHTDNYHTATDLRQTALNLLTRYTDPRAANLSLTLRRHIARS